MKVKPMDKLVVVVLARRASATALDAIARISRHIRDAERAGDTSGAALLYPQLYRARRRYWAAQATLSANPLPRNRHHRARLALKPESN
jgi:hypothetical protein